jgi:cell division septation protein DedD
MNIERYIPALLVEHDCVIVPGFGGFIGNYRPARINPVNHTFHPPSKSVLFNVSLKQNDGLLANRISQSENISFLESLRAITRMTESWNRILGEGQAVEIPVVGMIRRDDEGNLQFEQERDANFLADAYGLTAFVSPAIERDVQKQKSERKIRRFIEAPVIERRIIPKAVRWAAVLSLPVGLAAVMALTHTERVKNLAMNFSGLVYSVTSEPKPSAPKPKRTFVAPMRVTRALVKETPAIAPVHPAPVLSAQESEGNFAVILGAFRVKENAENLVAKLRGMGYRAQIFDTTRGGLYRVTLQKYPTQQEALAQLSTIRSAGYPSAWLLKKNN